MVLARGFAIVLAVILSCVFSGLVNRAAKAGASESPPAPDKAKAIIQVAEISEDNQKVLVPAKVEARVQTTMTSDVEGHVVEILRPLGSRVKEGETVLFLENKDPGFTYAKVPVRSPVAGVLSQLLVTEMSKVAQHDKLFTVINPQSLKITAEFSNQDLSLLKAGSQGVFVWSGVPYPVRLVGVSPMIDARTGTASGELNFVNLAGAAQLPAIGAIGQASFQKSRGKILLLPENSLLYQDGKPWVRTLNASNQVEKKAVELGEQRENQYIIQKGIAAGERVVVRTSRPIKDGETIEVDSGEKAKN